MELHAIKIGRKELMERHVNELFLGSSYVYMGFFVEIFRSQTLHYQSMYITEPELVQAVNLLNPSPSDTLMLFIPYCNLLDKESLIAPVSTSCSKMSPDVDPEAIISSLFTHPMEVTAPA